MEGWVYILSTKTHKLLKIGYTTGEPNVRASQLSDTSSPDPFIVEFALKMESPSTVESDVHLRLSGYRHTSNREFFNCKLDIAVQVVRDSAFGSKIISEQFSTNVEPSNEWLRKNEKEQEAKIIRQREQEDIKKQRKQQLENDINQRAKASAIDKERQAEKWSSSCIGLTYDQVFYPFKWSNAFLFVCFFPFSLFFVNWNRDGRVYKSQNFKCSSCNHHISRAVLSPTKTPNESCSQCNWQIDKNYKPLKTTIWIPIPDD